MYHKVKYHDFRIKCANKKLIEYVPPHFFKPNNLIIN